MSIIKNKIVKAFYATEVNYADEIPMDIEIVEFVEKLNKRQYIKTLISCSGHTTDEKDHVESPFFDQNNNYLPYLGFLVNETGWRIFWSDLLPELSSQVDVNIRVLDEKKTCAIIIVCDLFEDKYKFWDCMKSLFYYHFSKPNYK